MSKPAKVQRDVESQKVQIIELRCVEIEKNPFSANEEDADTYNALKKDIKARGIIEIPIVYRKEDGTPVCFSGWHRINAWMDLGNEFIEVRDLGVVELSPETEFNIVNNINTIKGKLSEAKALSIIVERQLKEFEIYGYEKLKERIKQQTQKQKEEIERRISIKKLSLDIATEFATDLYDNRDNVLLFLVKGDKFGMVLRTDVKTNKVHMENIKTLIEEYVKENSDGKTNDITEARD